MPRFRPVIISGGAGTRLWPVSTPERPKQFVDLFDGETLFGLTVNRLQAIEGAAPPMVVTGERHANLVREQLGVESPATLLLEPSGRNTAPAVIAAAMVADPDEVLVITPSDHIISDTQSFAGAVEAAISQALEGKIVTFGVTPDRPETGYGYIRAGTDQGPGFAIAEFVEKPERETAVRYLESGDYTWNSGMFVATSSTILGEAGTHCGEIVEAVRTAIDVMEDSRLGSAFEGAEAVSFDHAVMELTDRGMVIPIDVGWSDLGTYQALLAALPKDENGNHVSGPVTLIDCSGCFVRSVSSPLSVANLHSMVVVAEAGSVLVVPIDQSQSAKSLLEASPQP